MVAVSAAQHKIGGRQEKTGKNGIVLPRFSPFVFSRLVLSADRSPQLKVIPAVGSSHVVVFAEEVRQRASTNVHAEAHRTGEVQEFNTAAIVHREESIATLQDFGAAGIRHDCAAGSDDVTG